MHPVLEPRVAARSATRSASLSTVLFTALATAVASACAGGASASAAAHPPPGDVAAVREAVDAIFVGMRQADSDMVRARFAPAARFAMKSGDGGRVQGQPVDGWLDAIAGSEGRWDERVYDVVVQVDDDVAQVWAPYTFYLDGAVRHCGTNAMELLRVGDRWLVTQISDSRRTEGCPDPLSG